MNLYFFVDLKKVCKDLRNSHKFKRSSGDLKKVLERGKKLVWSSWIYLWQCVFRLSSLLTW